MSKQIDFKQKFEQYKNNLQMTENTASWPYFLELN